MRPTLWLLVAAAVALSPRAPADEPTQVRSIHRFTATAILHDSETGELTEHPTDALVSVIETPDAPTKSDAWLIVDYIENMKLVRIDRADLPKGALRYLPDYESYLFHGGKDGTKGDGVPIMRRSLRQNLQSLRKDFATPKSMQILDARGRPATEFIVKVETHLFEPPYVVFEGRPDAEGNVPTQLPISNLPPQALPSTMTVTHPVTSQQQVFSLPVCDQLGSTRITDMVRLAMLPGVTQPGDQLPSDVYGVLVTGPDGAPIAARIEVPYTGTVSFSFRTGPEGRAEVIVPPPISEARFGALAPEVSQSLSATIGADPTEGLARWKKASKAKSRLKVGEWNAIALAPGEQLRFQFLSSDRSTIEFEPNPYQSTLRLDRLDVEKHAFPSTEITWEDNRTMVTNPIELPATLQPVLLGLQFKPQRLEPGAGDSIIVWEPETPGFTLVGQVLDIRNGGPIEGAYVAYFCTRGVAWILAAMYPDDRDKVYRDVTADGRGVNVSSEAFDVPVGRNRDSRFYSGSASSRCSMLIARTDADGFFVLQLPAGREFGIMAAYSPDMMGVTAEVAPFVRSVGDDGGVVELPAAYLIPSSVLRVSVLAPDMEPDPHRAGVLRKSSTERISIKSVVSFPPNPAWSGVVPPSEPTLESPWQLAYPEGLQETGWPFELPVPADTTLQIVMRTRTWDSATWTDLGPFEQGSVNDLPQQRLLPPNPLRVHLKYAVGKPAAGLLIAMEEGRGAYTGQDGSALIWPPPRETIDLRVWSIPMEVMALNAKGITIPGPGDGMIPEIELVLDP